MIHLSDLPILSVPIHHDHADDCAPHILHSYAHLQNQSADGVLHLKDLFDDDLLNDDVFGDYVHDRYRIYVNGDHDFVNYCEYDYEKDWEYNATDCECS